MKYTGISLLLLVLLSGCASRNNKSVRAPIVHKQTTQSVQQSTLSPVVKKHIELKEVDDNNFNDKYMYPEDSVKKETAERPSSEVPTAKVSTVENSAIKTSTVPTPATTGAMTKAECITMISQEKFDKYSQMFGNENASIKRCAMLKAMSK